MCEHLETLKVQEDLIDLSILKDTQPGFPSQGVATTVNETLPWQMLLFHNAE